MKSLHKRRNKKARKGKARIEVKPITAGQSKVAKATYNR